MGQPTGDGAAPLELWGGPECSIVRIGDAWRDQTRETGHQSRLEDIDLIAGLGIRTVRYPLLWENIERDGTLDFSWSDERIARLEALGIEPIAGLLHHGSGPPHTHLLDADFAARFAAYAVQVAKRYPHIRRWTPINEPLTTARFAGLYGHWYPHRSDYPAFLRALVNQCRGIAAAMEAIRTVNPRALLVQTEDLGKVHSTPDLSHQADHENERRWLSVDLLTGRLRPSHPFYRFFVESGIAPDELDSFENGKGRPDLLGINYYLTSERFLDHRLHLYPEEPGGGNGRDSYVDVEAVRVDGLDAETGLAPRLAEAWERYRIPIAVTEVHHGCTRDEQLRWLSEVWREAEEARNRGADVRAITLWSLFGNVDWRSLVTRNDGIYDPGAFDIRSPAPRPTALAAAARSLTSKGSFDHAVLDNPGWWARPDRHYGWCGGNRKADAPQGRKLLITGATGTLGNALARIAEHRGLPFVLTARSDLDLADERSIADALDRHAPWAVINAAGFVRVEDAESERAACFAANAEGAGNLARQCAGRDLPFVTFSSDLVFDGRAGRRYRESDPPCPVGVYGASKAAAEQRVAEAGGRPLIIRTSAFFGPWDVHNFAWRVIRSLRDGAPVRACARTFVSPTFVPDLCHAVLDLLIDGETGLWHLANEGEVSWHGFARMLAEGAGLDPNRVIAEDSPTGGSTAMTSERGALMRPLERAVESYVRDVNVAEPWPVAAE